MLITTLLSLGLTFSNSSPTLNITQNNVNVDYVVLPSSRATSYEFVKFFYSTDNTSHFVADMRFDLSFDTNLNEYLQISYDVDFSNGYCYYAQESWLQNNYNVSAYSVTYLYDFSLASMVNYWISPNLILGTGEMSGYGFGGDSDVLNFTWDSTHNYALFSRVYFYLLNDLDSDLQDTYMDGYDQGYGTGYDTGYQDGYENGGSESYQDGYDNGYITGYNIGKSDGISISQYSFGSLFASISDTPILMIRRLFGFELFGTSLITVFVSLFTALVILMILKTVWGAKRK